MSRRAVVDSFDALVARPFDNGVNALCWPRRLAGDFAEVARRLAPDDGLVVVDAALLRALTLSDAGRVAADAMLDDMARLDALGREPVLNCIAAYARDERGLAIATDVMSFHVDRAPVEVDTWLCTYHGKGSEGLDNDDAHRLIDVPARRAALRAGFEGSDDEFAAFVVDGSFDLHYGENDGVEAFDFGAGNLWRIAVAWPGSRVLPCIHRAPATVVGDAPRLLLIC